MLISHRKQFIFAKTKKTAGTSVESYFERYCVADGKIDPVDDRETLVTPAGFIATRGVLKGNPYWHEHMTAAAIRDGVGTEIWDRYFKFTVVRDPFDKLVSAFHFLENRARQEPIWRQWQFKLRRLVGRRPARAHLGRVHWIKGQTSVERFRHWLTLGVIYDQSIFMIDGQACMDYFVRFEQLHDGLREVCSRLDIPFDSERFPRFKTGIRPANVNLATYYDEASIAFVQREFAWEIERFGYQAPQS